MAITWTKRVGDKWEPDGVSHEGLVASGPFTRCERVMSDIYSDETYCLVYNPLKGEYDEVHLGGAFELNCRSGSAVVDLDPSVKADVERRAAERAEVARKEYEARCEKERLEREEKERKAPKMGRRARVVRGRKVPVGTEGVVFWRGDSDYGERLGLATTDRKVNGRYADVVWVASSNVENIESDEDYEARKKVLDAAKAAEKAARDAEWQKTQDEAKAAREKSLENLDEEPVPF
jgi:hypothetical protein